MQLPLGYRTIDFYIKNFQLLGVHHDLARIICVAVDHNLTAESCFFKVGFQPNFVTMWQNITGETKGVI